jgi:hypothetical protein
MARFNPVLRQVLQSRTAAEDYMRRAGFARSARPVRPWGEQQQDQKAGAVMAVDLASLPGWAIGGLALAMVFTGALARTPVARLVERWGQARAVVRIIREQRRMANLALGSGTELRHSAVGGSKLVIRRSASPAAPETDRGE